MNEDHDPTRGTKSRLPFSPTIKPSLAGSQGGIGAILYALVALFMCGFAIYQMRVEHLQVTHFRVFLPLAAAAWFAVRGAMMFVSGRAANGDVREKTDETAAAGKSDKAETHDEESKDG